MATFKATYGGNKMNHEPESNIHYAVMGYGEFLDYVQNTTKSPDCDSESSRRVESGDKPWAGTPNWDVAINHAVHGWDAGLKELEEYVETDAALISIENSIVGHAVDVGRFLIGVPDPMLSFYDDTYRNKAPLTVYVKLTYTCEMSGSQAMKYCSKVLETVMLLNRTFDVRLVGVFWTQHGTPGDSLLLVNIKDTDERFVLNNLAFSFNPSFFRRLWFKWLETTNFWTSGYGSSPQGGFGQGRVLTALTKIQPPHEQILFLPDIYDSDNMNPEYIVKKAISDHNPI